MATINVPKLGNFAVRAFTKLDGMPVENVSSWLPATSDGNNFTGATTQQVSVDIGNTKFIPYNPRYEENPKGRFNWALMPTGYIAASRANSEIIHGRIYKTTLDNPSVSLNASSLSSGFGEYCFKDDSFGDDGFVIHSVEYTGQELPYSDSLPNTQDFHYENDQPTTLDLNSGVRSANGAFTFKGSNTIEQLLAVLNAKNGISKATMHNYAVSVNQLLWQRITINNRLGVTHTFEVEEANPLYDPVTDPRQTIVVERTEYIGFEGVISEYGELSATNNIAGFLEEIQSFSTLFDLLDWMDCPPYDPDELLDPDTIVERRITQNWFTPLNAEAPIMELPVLGITCTLLTGIEIITREENNDTGIFALAGYFEKVPHILTATVVCDSKFKAAIAPILIHHGYLDYETGKVIQRQYNNGFNNKLTYVIYPITHADDMNSFKGYYNTGVGVTEVTVIDGVMIDWVINPYVSYLTTDEFYQKMTNLYNIYPYANGLFHDDTNSNKLTIQRRALEGVYPLPVDGFDDTFVLEPDTNYENFNSFIGAHNQAYFIALFAGVEDWWERGGDAIFILRNGTGYYTCDLTDVLDTGEVDDDGDKVFDEVDFFGFAGGIMYVGSYQYTLGGDPLPLVYRAVIPDLPRGKLPVLTQEYKAIGFSFIPCQTHCLGKGGITSKV